MSTRIPSPQQILQTSSERGIVNSVNAGIAGIIGGITFLVLGPVQALSQQFSDFLNRFISTVTGALGSIPAGVQLIVESGAQETAESLSGFTGFFLAIGVFVFAAYAWSYLQDETSDIPFTGVRIPFFGPDEED